MPGVPSEMREMLLGTILPDLRRRTGQTAVIRSRVLRTWGASESGVAEMVAERIDELDKLGNPTIAFQASGIDGIKVRIVAKCDDEATATRMLDAEEALMRGLLGDLIFGIDEQSMETVVLDLLRSRGLTVAAAETLTGGILSARMSAVDPAMETFRGARSLRRREPLAAGRRSSAPARPRRRCARSSARAWAWRRSSRMRPRASSRVAFFSPSPSTGCCTPRRCMLTPDRKPHARVLRDQSFEPAAPEPVVLTQLQSGKERTCSTESLIATLLSMGGMAAMAQERMPQIPADKLTEAQKKASTEFAEGRGYAVRGPFAAMLRSPEVMLRAKAIGDICASRAQFLRASTSSPSSSPRASGGRTTNGRRIVPWPRRQA